MSAGWRCALWALMVFPVRRESRMCAGRGRRGQRAGGETCTSSPRVMYPGTRKDSFISRSRVSLSVRSGGQSESGRAGGEGREGGPEVLSGPVHFIARHKWQPKVGRETRIETQKVSPHEGAIPSSLYRDRSRISLAFADIAEVIRTCSFYTGRENCSFYYVLTSPFANVATSCSAR